MRHLAIMGTIVLFLAGATDGRVQPAADSGAAGAWQKLRKLQTTASVMHTTAHPDDEHGGLLTLLSRGRGARVSLLTLTRGESGDNAIGPELFDALGLIRTEELLLSNRYYGVDRQYFGTVVDYGYSKRLDEALEKWGHEHVLRDVVRIIRMERPFVIVSRFQGNERDGHGNHSAAGLITREAFDLAGDPSAFPEQLAAGLMPWQPLKLYMGGVRANEDWTIRVETSEYDPVLGDSYQSIARLGLGFQRSQNSGRVMRQPGPSAWYYKRLRSVVEAPDKEDTFFDGIDTTIAGLYRTVRAPAPAGAERLLTAVQTEVQRATDAFRFTDPSESAPALARALGATRAALATLDNADVRAVLATKAGQIAEALHAVLGVELTALAQPAKTPSSTGPFSGHPPMPPVVPGQTFEVRTTLVGRSPHGLTNAQVELHASREWKVSPAGSPAHGAPNQPLVNTFTVTVPESPALTRPYFSRESIQHARYTIADESRLHQPASAAPVEVVARYAIEGVTVELRRPVTRLESNLPYGFDTRELAVVPGIALTLTPSHAIAPVSPPAAAGGEPRSVRLTVEVLNNRQGESEGTVRLDLPAGWRTSPSEHRFQLARAGERAVYAFDVIIPTLEVRDYRIGAVAASAGREYRDGYRALRHRDLETRYLYTEAVTSVRGIDVVIAPGLKVGYVMGVGDDVPTGLAQLGVDVQLLNEQDLATGELSRFDAIVTGTRAYAVREDLRTHNRRLLDFVRDGGNLIVLYNTPEFVPALYAPYPAELPAGAEEVSEEDSPVDILAPDALVLNTPNRITQTDFENWIEQRGSKFWTTWDSRYSAVLATWDKNQPPQKGGWLHARYGKGHYTYFAYALHRQLPYGVPGVYRLVANLLSLGRSR